MHRDSGSIPIRLYGVRDLMAYLYGEKCFQLDSHWLSIKPPCVAVRDIATTNIALISSTAQADFEVFQ